MQKYTTIYVVIVKSAVPTPKVYAFTNLVRCFGTLGETNCLFLFNTKSRATMAARLAKTNEYHTDVADIYRITPNQI